MYTIKGNVKAHFQNGVTPEFQAEFLEKSQMSQRTHRKRHAHEANPTPANKTVRIHGCNDCLNLGNAPVFVLPWASSKVEKEML